MRIEKISAITFRVVDMGRSLRFYRDVLGMDLLYGGEGAGFSSLRAKDVQSSILNLELGQAVTGWGRIIFYVADVDAFWAYLKERGFDPECGTLHGVNDISTCLTRTATSCRLLTHSAERTPIR